MEEKVGNVILNYDLYCGKDYYEDGSEDELLEIVRTYSRDDYSQIIKQRSKWPLLYHLSNIRQNVVEWLPIEKTDSVLEIGAGCGAITGALSQKAACVDCIELSKKRSLINAHRNKDYNNIRISVGNFQDIAPKIEKKYDYITLIGVLEYAGSYICSNDPYYDFLNIIKDKLSPGGKIVIAIENKFGMKYWAGCKEDHLGTYFSGLEGYKKGDGVKTFSKIELEELFQRVGMANFEFFYPYPDYKLPKVIYSDYHLPQIGELTNNLSNFDGERYVLFDEGKVFDEVIKSNMFPFFSNSFLVLLGAE